MRGMVGALRRAWLHPVSRVIQVMVVGLAGAWLTVVAWGGVKCNLRLVTVQASFRPAVEGGSEVELPPFGSLSARTHHGPVKLRLQLDQVHVKEMVEWLKQRSSPSDAAARLDNEVSKMLSRLVAGTLLAALIGAVLASALIGAGWKRTLVGTAAGMLAVAAPIALAMVTYDKAAFSSPTFEGELSRAPYLLDAVQRGYAGAVRNLPVITDQIVDLYRRLEANGSSPRVGQTSALRALLISDIHNNPLGLRFALDLADSYDARLVLMCGDVTDFGHPIEGELLSEWERFTAPVLFVTGNHDSRSTVETLSGVPGVRALDNGAVVEVEGLRVVGYGDPAARRSGAGNVNAARGDLQALAQRIIDDLSGGEPPDVLMAHNFRVARDVAGHVPVIVTGHSHSAFVEERRGSVIVNPGTTGAAGLRYFTSKRGAPYTAAVLHFARGDRGLALSAVDLVELQQPSGDFVVTRKNIGALAVKASSKQ